MAEEEEEEDTRIIRSIRLENILSYGPDSMQLDLEPLNVLIGPNASGKSNLIEALSLFAATPQNFQVPIREGGGIRDWLWKGTESPPVAKIEVMVTYPNGPTHLWHRLSFTESGGRFLLVDEAVAGEQPTVGNTKPYSYYAYQDGRPVINFKSIARNNGGGRAERNLRREDVSPEQSILSQRIDPDSLPELTYLGTIFRQMRFYREWNLGRYTEPRLPLKTDAPADFLEEDASNLSLVLNNLERYPALKQDILKRLRGFYERIIDYRIIFLGGTVQIYFEEKGLKQLVPATRLSDGTLRYLCLLAILCHPEPPPLICIEEPELGLHPDAIPSVAELLLAASQRTQLVVTTHSDILISALSDYPEAVVVCERDENGTTLQRLSRTQLDEWLERYRLGELWRMGEIGGNPQ